MLFEFPKIGSAKSDDLVDSAAIPCLQILRGYWEGLREGGALPNRNAIQPSRLGGALSNVFMIEHIAGGTGRFRVAGSAISDVLGVEPRGLPFGILLEPVARSALSRVLDQVFTSATVLDIALEAERTIGRPYLAGRMIILPVQCGRGAYHQGIGALALSGHTGRTPRRFGITRMRSEKIDAAAGFIPMADTTPLQAQRLPDFDVNSPQNARSHLRLVHSRD